MKLDTGWTSQISLIWLWSHTNNVLHWFRHFRLKDILWSEMVRVWNQESFHIKRTTEPCFSCTKPKKKHFHSHWSRPWAGPRRSSTNIRSCELCPLSSRHLPHPEANRSPIDQSSSYALKLFTVSHRIPVAHQCSASPLNFGSAVWC